MDKIRRIAELMQGFQSDNETFFTATVKSIEGNTCTVVVDDLSISDVRLLPTTTTTDNRVLLTPAIDSHVLIGSFSGNFSNLFVLASDTVDKIEITCNGQNVMILISQLISTLCDATVITPAGNGTFDPAVIASLKQIEMLFKQIFK